MSKLVLIYLSFIICIAIHAQENIKVSNPDPLRFKDEISAFAKWDNKNSYPKNAVLFVGSSSIRLWDTSRFFPNLQVINRGFGGAHISDVNYYIHETVLKYDPQIIVFYCGDNDIAYKKSPKQVLSDYQAFLTQVHKQNPDTEVFYIAIKPSILRWDFWPQMDITNKLILEFSKSDKRLFFVDIATPMLKNASPPDASLFVADGLHLSEKGYQMWQNILNIQLQKM